MTIQLTTFSAFNLPGQSELLSFLDLSRTRMKLLILFIFLISGSSEGFAYCLKYVIDFWPKEKTIKQNSIIIINGYGGSQKVINKLNRKYPIYLKSGAHKVNLKVKEIINGDNIRQAILILDEKLEADKEYLLFIDNLPEKHFSGYRSGDYIPETKKYYFAKWTVENGIDTVYPIWKVKPVEKSKSYKEYGCGPAAYVHFRFVAEDKSSYVIKAKIINSLTKRKSEYFLEPGDSILMVGYGMCSGPFRFKYGANFEVSFDIMDASGNLTEWTDNRILFTKPNRPKRVRPRA